MGREQNNNNNVIQFPEKHSSMWQWALTYIRINKKEGSLAAGAWLNKTVARKYWERLNHLVQQEMEKRL